jgi:hypothetical protein
MATLEFDRDELLEQARGNQTALWHLALRRARDQEGSVDGWGRYVGEDFAPSWDDLGDGASALEVARQAGLNYATTSDMRPLEVTGDDSTAQVTLEGPDPEWLENSGTRVEDHDRVNELIFEAIARRRGLTLTCEREGSTFRMTFAR